MRTITTNPDCGTPRYAGADLFIYNHQEGSNVEAPVIAPCLLWHKGMDLRPVNGEKSENPAFPTEYTLEPDPSDVQPGLDLQLTTYRWKDEAARPPQPGKIVRGVNVPVGYLEPDVLHTMTLPIQLPQTRKSAAVYVYAKPELQNVLMGVVYRKDGESVPDLLEIRLEDVLDGGVHGARLQSAVAEKYDLHYQQARALFITGPQEPHNPRRGVKRKRDLKVMSDKPSSPTKAVQKLKLKAGKRRRG